MVPRKKRGAKGAKKRSSAGVLPKYAVNFEGLESTGQSINFLVHNRLCWQCQQIFDDIDTKEMRIDDYMQRISDHCSQQIDYLLSGTPLTEALFRALIAGNNRPMTITELQDQLSLWWTNVIYLKDLSEDLLVRLMERGNEYMIARVN